MLVNESIAVHRLWEGLAGPPEALPARCVVQYMCVAIQLWYNIHAVQYTCGATLQVGPPEPLPTTRVAVIAVQELKATCVLQQCMVSDGPACDMCTAAVQGE